jgi:hypothetical protein
MAHAAVAADPVTNKSSRFDMLLISIQRWQFLCRRRLSNDLASKEQGACL